MGVTKRALEHEEEKREAATDIAVRAGVLSRCEIHSECYFDAGTDPVAAYKLGNALLANGELAGVFDSPRDMTDHVKIVVDEAPMQCTMCSKMLGDD